VVGVKKKTSMIGGMPPIEYGHGLDVKRNSSFSHKLEMKTIYMAYSYGNERKEMVLKPYESTKFHCGWSLLKFHLC